MPEIYIKEHTSRVAHDFYCWHPKCTGCKNPGKVCRYLELGNISSTGNIFKHVCGCWGQKALDQVMRLDDPENNACQGLQAFLDGRTLEGAFSKATKKGAVIYLTLQMTKTKVK